MQNTKESSGTESNGKTSTQNENVKTKRKERQLRMSKRLAEKQQIKVQVPIQTENNERSEESVAVKTVLKKLS